MQLFVSKWPARHSSKHGTATMGGLFLIPIGVIVAEVLVGFSSVEVLGASIATIAFATIGFIDDLLSMVQRKKVGLSSWIRILMEVIYFSYYVWAVFYSNKSNSQIKNFNYKGNGSNEF